MRSAGPMCSSTRTTRTFTDTVTAVTITIFSRGRFPFPLLTAGLLPFLVSRQVIAGAGKVGVEGQESGFVPGHYQLSQRADFMETDLSVDTMQPADSDIRGTNCTRFGKNIDGSISLSGDANMCEYSTALKVGTTQLALELIARDVAPALELEHPVIAVKQLSRDQNLKATVRQKNGSTITGLDIQEQYYPCGREVLGRY
mgnify:CR=1 FL=1